MNGVTIPGVSAGSNHVGASEMWTPQVIWPSGAAPLGTAVAAEISRTRTVTERRGLIMSLQPGGSVGNRTISALSLSRSLPEEPAERDRVGLAHAHSAAGSGTTTSARFDIAPARCRDSERLVPHPRRPDDARLPRPDRGLHHAGVLGGGAGDRLLSVPAALRREAGRAEIPGRPGHDPDHRRRRRGPPLPRGVGDVPRSDPAPRADQERRDRRRG